MTRSPGLASLARSRNVITSRLLASEPILELESLRATCFQNCDSTGIYVGKFAKLLWVGVAASYSSTETVTKSARASCKDHVIPWVAG